MNENLIINRVSIKRKGLETLTYLLPSVTDILKEGSVKRNHIDWQSVKEYLDGLYVSKNTYTQDIATINSKLITLSIGSDGNLEYNGYKFLNVTNYAPSNTEGLTARVTALEGSVSSILGNITSINTTLQGLSSIYASKNHTHSFSELTGISEDSGYLNIGTGGNKFIEILPSKLIELNALATQGGNVYITPKVRSGEKAILVAEPDENKKFVKWVYNNLDISTNAVHILNNPLSGAAYIGVFTDADSDEPTQPTLYTLTLNQPTNGSIIATANGVNFTYGTVTLDHGTIIHLEASANTGYKFNGWDGVPAGKENLQTLDFAINSNTIISVSFTNIQYTVTVEKATDLNDAPIGTNVYPTIKIGGSVQNNPATVNYNTSVTLEAVASIDNYEFSRWSDNYSTNRIRTQNITNDLVTHPMYNRPTYTITFGSNNTNYGTVTATYLGTNQSIISPASIAKGSHITLTAHPADGYELTSWSGIPNGSTYDNVVVDQALNILAIFTAIAPVPTVKVFFGEVINNVWTKFGDSVIVRYISLQLLTNPYLVQETVNLDGRQLSVLDYEFVHWEEDDHEVIEDEVLHRTADTEDLTFYGTFAKRVTIQVVTDNSNAGTVSGAGTYVEGNTTTISATAGEGYHFVKWSDNNTSNPRTITVSSNVTTYTAVFALNTYTITTSVSPSNSGSITGLSSSYNYGEECSITAQPATGYHFVEWRENNQQVSTEATYEFVVNKDRTLVAVFAKNSYTITTTATTGGSASPETQTVEHGTSVTVTATPNTGYAFTKWTSGTSTTSVSTSASYTFNATSSITLKANFTLNTYTVSASVDPTGSGTVTVGGTANSKSISHGSTTQLVATPNSGYTFVNWTLNGTLVSESASYTTPAITAAVSYVAHFAEIPPVDNTLYYFASTNDDYSPNGKTVNTLEVDSATNKLTTSQLEGVDTLVFLAPSSILITSIKDVIAGTEIISRFLTHSTTYNDKEYTAYYYTDPNVEINGRFIVDTL